jgi:hypothetical protein
MDTVLFLQIFAFTAVDIFSKERAVLLRPLLEAVDLSMASLSSRFGGWYGWEMVGVGQRKKIGD